MYFCMHEHIFEFISLTYSCSNTLQVKSKTCQSEILRCFLKPKMVICGLFFVNLYSYTLTPLSAKVVKKRVLME